MEELVKTQLEYSDGEGEMSRSASFSNRLSPQAFAEKLKPGPRERKRRLR